MLPGRFSIAASESGRKRAKAGRWFHGPRFEFSSLVGIGTSLPRADINVETPSERELVHPLVQQLNPDRFAPAGEQFHRCERSRGIYMHDPGSQLVGAVGQVADFHLMRPHINNRVFRISLKRLWQVHYLTFQVHHISLNAGPEDVHIAEEIAHEGVGRLFIDFLGRADLSDSSLVHHHHHIGHFQGLLLVVSDKYAGYVDFIMELSKPAPQILANLGIERSEGFVKQEDLRFHSKRARQRDALSLSPESCDGRRDDIDPS